MCRGESVGWRIEQQGLRARVEVWGEDDGAGLYKAYALGPSGRCLLGTLAPEGGRLYLERILTVDSLKRQGCWPVERVEEVLEKPFQERPMQIRWEDPVLRQCAACLPRHTACREGEGRVSLRFPFDPCAPFPLTPAFCFARVEGGCLIFSFREDGSPCVPECESSPSA
jgi:hypothetical protein